MQKCFHCSFAKCAFCILPNIQQHPPWVSTSFCGDEWEFVLVLFFSKLTCFHLVSFLFEISKLLQTHRLPDSCHRVSDWDKFCGKISRVIEFLLFLANARQRGLQKWHCTQLWNNSANNSATSAKKDLKLNLEKFGCWWDCYVFFSGLMMLN